MSSEFNTDLTSTQKQTVPTTRIPLTKRISVEWLTWASLSFVAALTEGGVLGVIIKNGFEGKVSESFLNLSVAIATGAPSFSNLLSFYWVRLSQGRSKARLVSQLAVSFCALTFTMSFIPFTEQGLVILLVVLILARVSWSGILTIRSNIWRANYPRYIRGKVTAKLATMSALIMSAVGVLVGWILDWQFMAFRWVFIVLSIVALYGAYRYRSLAVRHQQNEIEREKRNRSQYQLFRSFRLLKHNPAFGKYMLAMFILGSGNLMFMAPLIVFLSEQTDLSQFQQVLVTAGIPFALIPIAVGRWARLLDSNHIFRFRSLHSWGFVITIFVFLIAQITKIDALFYIGSILYGIAISGGVIGWNLGHNDFVRQTKCNSNVSKSDNIKKNTNDNKHETENPMDYMAIHVTLAGLRGLLMPLLGIVFYNWLEAISPSYVHYALLLPLVFVMTGAGLFFIFNRQHNASIERN